jgi:hypothetical protein
MSMRILPLRYHNLRIGGRRCILIDDYVPPNPQDYNAGGPFSILIDVEGVQPRLMVPKWLQCFRGNPLHINQPALAEFSDKWKWACSELKDRSFRRFLDEYTEDALMELVDEYFRDYPWRT